MRRKGQHELRAAYGTIEAAAGNRIGKEHAAGLGCATIYLTIGAEWCSLEFDAMRGDGANSGAGGPLRGPEAGAPGGVANREEAKPCTRHLAGTGRSPVPYGTGRRKGENRRKKEAFFDGTKSINS